MAATAAAVAVAAGTAAAAVGTAAAVTAPEAAAAAVDHEREEVGGKEVSQRDVSKKRRVWAVGCTTYR